MARAAACGIDLITTFEQSVPEGQERALQNYSGPIQKQTRVMRQPEWTAHDAGQACGHAGLPDHLYAAFAFRFAGDESQRKPLKRALMVRTAELAERDNWKRIRPCANCGGSGLTHEIIYDDVFDQKTRTVKRRARGKTGDWETKPATCPICRSFGTAPVSATELNALPDQRHALDDPCLLRGAGQVFVVEQLVDLAIFEEWLTVHYVTGLMQLARDKLWAGLIGIEHTAWERNVLEQYRGVQCVIDNWCGTAYSLVKEWLIDDADVA